MSPELDRLIDASLTDGVITPQEYEAIMNRARQEGENLAEIDIFVQSRLQKIQQSREKNAPKARKCPACGEYVNALTGICPACGNVLDIESTLSSDVLKLFNQMQHNLKRLKESIKDTDNFNEFKAKVENDIQKANVLYGENPKVKNFTLAIESDLQKAIKSRKNYHKRIILYIVLFIVYCVVVFIMLQMR